MVYNTCQLGIQLLGQQSSVAWHAHAHGRIMTTQYCNWIGKHYIDPAQVGTGLGPSQVITTWGGVANGQEPAGLDRESMVRGLQTTSMEPKYILGQLVGY